MTPVVSIVIPAYNAAAYIAEALASAQAQTLADIEILVIDDASTDTTAQIVAAAASTDPRIRLLRQPVNAGPSAARNRGFDAARGEWLALLDADDAFTADRLEHLVAAAVAVQADVYADNLLLVSDGSPTRPMIPAALLSEPRPLGLEEFVRRNVADPKHPGLNLGFLKPVLRRAFLDANMIRYDERVRFAEDFALYTDCFVAGARWWLSPAAGYRYRVRADSLTQVQTVADLAVLRGKLRVLRDRAGGDAALVRAARRHLRVIDRSYHYRAVTDAVKARRARTAFAALFDDSRSFWLVAEATLQQAPTILRKLLAGGYRKPPG